MVPEAILEKLEPMHFCLFRVKDFSLANSCFSKKCHPISRKEGDISKGIFS